MTAPIAFNVPKLKIEDLVDRMPSPMPTPIPRESAICIFCKKVFDDHGIKSKYCSKNCSLVGCKIIKSKAKKVVNFTMVNNKMHIYSYKEGKNG